MRRLLLIAAAVAATATAPVAEAATLHVDASVPIGSWPCGAPATPCETIGEALLWSRAAGFPGPDTIRLAPGTYNEQVALTHAQDSGTVLEGSGAATVIRVPDPPGPSPGAVVLGSSTPPYEDGIVIRDLAVEVPATVLRSGVVVHAANARMEHVRVLMTGGTGQGVGVWRSPTLLDHVEVSGTAPWSGPGVFVAPAATGGTTIRDSRIASLHQAMEVFAPTAITRSVVTMPATTAATVVAAQGATPFVLDSSLVTGGGAALSVVGSGEAVTATIRNSTLDARAAGVDDSAGTYRAIAARGSDAGGSATVTVDSSILVEGQQAITSGGGTSAIVCASSDTPEQVQPAGGTLGAISCGAAQGNSSSTPAALFVDAPGGEFRLRGDSPAVDTGSTAPLAEGESATDLAGSARVLDGNLDCVARRDKGAYELTGAANTPPVVSIAVSPERVTAGSPARLTASATDEDPLAALTFAWTFGDGTTASGNPAAHVFGAAGSFGVGVTATDTRGCQGTASRSVTVTTSDRTAPVITRLSLRMARFRVGRPPRGTVIRHRLSERATVTATIHRVAAGRLKGGRCVAPARAPRGRRCTRYLRRARFLRSGRAGDNRIAFAGRPGGRALPPGTYRLRLRARDAAGNRSRIVSTRFTIVG